MDTSGTNEIKGLGHVGPTVLGPILGQERVSPGGFHQYTTNMSPMNSLGHPIPSASSMAGPSGMTSSSTKRRQLTETEWDNLRDTLYKYYIEENKTLREVLKIMVNHGYSLTQKQLTSRFSEWGFKKNVSLSEVERFLHAAPGADASSAQDQDGVFNVEGVRVTPAKRERWQKRLRLAANEDIPAPRHDTHEPTHLDDVIELPPTTTAPEHLGTPVERLFRLLAKLHITTPGPDDVAHFQSLSERSAIEEDPAESPEAISREELLTLTNRHLFGVPTERSRIDCWQLLSQTGITQQSGTSRKPTLSGTFTSPFKFPWLDPFLPDPESLAACSPLNVELYPFPPHHPGSPVHSAKTHYVPLYERARLEFAQCTEEIRLRQAAISESLSSGKISDPLLALTERLAGAYFDLGQYDKAEQELSKLLPHLVKRHGPQSPHVVSVKTQLAVTIFNRCHYEEAMQMAREAYSSALVIDTSGGTLVRESMRLLAGSYGHLRKLDQAEDLLRQLLQIELSNSGPWDSQTLATISNLCYSMTATRRFRESEELLRVALELANGGKGTPGRRKCQISRNLAEVLYENGNLGDSELLFRRTIDMSVELLGDEHRDTLYCRYGLCKVLHEMGKLGESYELYTRTVEQLIRTMGEYDWMTITSMARLSCLLVEMGRMEEAEGWMRRALEYSGVGESWAERFWAHVALAQAGDDRGNNDNSKGEETSCKPSHGRHFGEKAEQRQRKVMELYEEMKQEIVELVYRDKSE
ncbi:hypothetical protein V8F20_002312 [Naviculisporaceae sp. PSN 640]